MFILGVVAGRVAGSPQPTASHSRAAGVLSLAGRQVARARVRMATDSSWESRRELLRQLCFLQEAQVNLVTDQGERPAAAALLVPTAEQEALLQALVEGARTAAQRRRCAALEYRVYEMLPRSHGHEPE